MRIDVDLRHLDRLLQLTDQLCAATAIASGEEFARWEQKIRQDYLCLVDDIAGNVREEAQALAA